MKIGYQAMSVIAFVMLVGVSSASAADAREATISATQGEVFVRQEQGEWMPAEPGMKLGLQDELKTDKHASADILLDKGNVGNVHISEKSLFKIDRMDVDRSSGDKFTMLNLAIGKVLVHAEKLEGASRFEVKTPTSTTGVRGTMFEVSVE